MNQYTVTTSLAHKPEEKWAVVTDGKSLTYLIDRLCRLWDVPISRFMSPCTG
jgi:hypothetical protein